MPKNQEPKRKNRAPLNMRVSDEFRARLEESARRSGRSLTREVEYLVMLGARGGPHPDTTPQTEELVEAIEGTIEMIERFSGKKWHEDPEAAAAVHLAIASLVRYVANVPEVTRTEFNNANNGMGMTMAAIWLSQNTGISMADFAERVDANEVNR